MGANAREGLELVRRDSGLRARSGACPRQRSLSEQSAVLPGTNEKSLRESRFARDISLRSLRFKCILKRRDRGECRAENAERKREFPQGFRGCSPRIA